MRCGNKTTIRSLTDRDEHVLHGSAQVNEAFQRHFAQLFGDGDGSTTIEDFCSYLNGLLQLLVAEVRFCKKSIMVTKMRGTKSDCANHKSSGLPYEFYAFMTDLLRDPYQVFITTSNRSEEFSMMLVGGLVTLLNKDVLRNFRPITLLNREFKILATVLTKGWRLSLVV